METSEKKNRRGKIILALLPAVFILYILAVMAVIKLPEFIRIFLPLETKQDMAIYFKYIRYCLLIQGCFLAVSSILTVFTVIFGFYKSADYLNDERFGFIKFFFRAFLVLLIFPVFLSLRLSDDYKFLETAEKYHQALTDYTEGNTLTLYGTVSSTQMKTIPGPYYKGKGEYIASIGIYDAEAYQSLVLNAPYFIYDDFEFDPQRIYKFEYIEKTKTIVSITETERMENLY